LLGFIHADAVTHLETGVVASFTIGEAMLVRETTPLLNGSPFCVIS